MFTNDNEDPWWAPDKLYHLLFCFFLTFLFSSIAARTRYPFLRRHSIWVGSILSLLAGAAKEAADHLGFFQSSGASAKDAVADFIGALIAYLVLSLVPFRFSGRPEKDTDQVRWVSMVWTGYWIRIDGGVGCFSESVRVVRLAWVFEGTSTMISVFESWIRVDPMKIRGVSG